MSQWADQTRRLSPEASAEPGRWYTARAEYMRGVMDAVSDPTVRQVVVMSAAQVGKTEVLLNMIGFHVDQDPAPILVVQPTLSMAQAFSKDRLAPMFRDTPNLKGKVRDPRSRDSGNTTLHKVFPGGHVTIAGANSAAGLASRPVRIVLCDEVDRYPSSAGTEGDPIRLAAKRTTASYTAGDYRWQAYITRDSDSERLTIDSGTFEVVANRSASTADLRSHAKVMLDKIESILEGRADGDYAGRELTRPVYRPSRRPRDVLSGGSISRLELLTLATMLSVSGCASIDTPVAAGCEWARPIILAEDERLKVKTMWALLAHNLMVEEFCT